MDPLLHSSESSGDEADEGLPIRRVWDRINFDGFSRQCFGEAFRLTPLQVEYLLTDLGLGERLATATQRSKDLSSKERLLATLSWLGSGSQQHATGRLHGISKATVCRISKEVIASIVAISPQIICWPNNTNDLANKFLAKGRFPFVCGVVDGVMINIDSSADVHDENGVVVVRRVEEHYVNRHGNHALNVMAICDPCLEFLAVNASWPGSVHDLRALKNSTVYTSFQQGWRPFPGAVVLGDSGYTPTLEWLITPLAANPDDPVERRFNRAHKSTRRLVENSFGVLKERFPCLNHLRLCPEYAAQIVIACCTLHNVACTVDRVNDPILVVLDEVVVQEVYEEEVSEGEEGVIGGMAGAVGAEPVVVEQPGGPPQHELLKSFRNP